MGSREHGLRGPTRRLLSTAILILMLGGFSVASAVSRDAGPRDAGPSADDDLPPMADIDGVTAATSAPGPSVPEEGITKRGCDCSGESDSPASAAALVVLLPFTRRSGRRRR